jgi:hypothetical protein
MSLKSKLLGAAVLFVAGVWVMDEAQLASGVSAPSADTTGDIPNNYLALYQQAAGTCPNLDWALLAAVGKIETNHGRTELPGVHSGANHAGASGPMQFIASTWRNNRELHPEIGPNVYDPAHAIPAAAHLLCDEGVRDGDIYGAIFAYNHAHWYVQDVLAQADAYR